MTSPKIQTNHANLGNGGSGLCPYLSPQTAHNTNIVAIFATAGDIGNLTSVSDDAGNDYDFLFFQVNANGPTGGPGLWLYGCFDIVASSAENNVALTWDNGEFFDAIVVEYPPTGGLRIAGGANQFGAPGPRLLQMTLAGTQPGDFIVSFGESENDFPLVGDIDGLAANFVEDDAAGDQILVQDGFTASASTFITMNPNTGDWWLILAAALKPSGAVAPINSLFFGAGS